MTEIYKNRGGAPNDAYCDICGFTAVLDGDDNGLMSLVEGSCISHCQGSKWTYLDICSDCLKTNSKRVRDLLAFKNVY